MKIAFSGMQPTGDIHLGNYLGMISPLLDLTSNKDCSVICSVVDLHAITVWQDPKELYNNSLNLTAFLIACGLNKGNSSVFLQSNIKEHTELAWILSCTAKIGWLNRMTQFKEKANNKEKASCGLYFYPILMAADILLYNAEIVPVGEDQKQHLEFARDLAIAFNSAYNTNLFKIPSPMITEGARVMSLKDGTKKMSKSDPSELSKILITDSNDAIAEKIKKAKTDNLPINGTTEELKTRPEIHNLINIYALATKVSLEEALVKFKETSFSKLKSELTEVVINLLHPIRLSYNKVLQDKYYIKQVLKDNSNKIQKIATNNLNNIKKVIGLIDL